MYGFVTVSGRIYAIPAKLGQTTVSCGGIIYQAHAPRTADERHAVDALDASLKKPLSQKKLDRLLAKGRRNKRSLAEHSTPRERISALTDRDIQIAMAEKIVAGAQARGEVTVRDFDQAGIPADRIEKNKEAAFRLARRREPRLDGMVAP